MGEFGSQVRMESRYDRADGIDPDALGRLLRSENVKSLRCRYPCQIASKCDPLSLPITTPRVTQNRVETGRALRRMRRHRRCGAGA